MDRLVDRLDRLVDRFVAPNDEVSYLVVDKLDRLDRFFLHSTIFFKYKESSQLQKIRGDTENASNLSNLSKPVHGEGLA